MCNLRCSFCQNHDISHQKNGFHLRPDELADWFIKLQEVGSVHNINLITPEHVTPQGKSRYLSITAFLRISHDLAFRAPFQSSDKQQSPWLSWMLEIGDLEFQLSITHQHSTRSPRWSSSTASWIFTCRTSRYGSQLRPRDC